LNACGRKRDGNSTDKRELCTESSRSVTVIDGARLVEGVGRAGHVFRTENDHPLALGGARLRGGEQSRIDDTGRGGRIAYPDKRGEADGEQAKRLRKTMA
jgi:hypothetical protein